MALETITKCPLCGREDYKPWLTARDYTVTKEEFELQKCNHCNLIITNPRPNSESIGKYYASDNYISHSGKSRTLFDKIYLRARNLTLKWKHQLITIYYPEPKKILDYGCGTGEFLHYMKNKGWSVTGIEPNETARKKANHLLGNNVLQSLESIKGNSVDAITLWHVLEHIHDLNNTIQNLKNLLSPTGYIFIAVPNPNSHDCEHYKKYWAGYDVPRHLWHFTQDTIKTLLKNNGLKIVATEPMKLDSYYVSLLSEQYRTPPQNKIVSGLKAFFEGLISNISATRTGEYSSLIYIVRQE